MKKPLPWWIFPRGGKDLYWFFMRFPWKFALLPCIHSDCSLAFFCYSTYCFFLQFCYWLIFPYRYCRITFFLLLLLEPQTALTWEVDCSAFEILDLGLSLKPKLYFMRGDLYLTTISFKAFVLSSSFWY